MKMKLLLVILLIFLIFVIYSFINFIIDLNNANNNLNNYNYNLVETEFGTVSYVDEGNGEPVLISHGIFGGFDQGYVTLDKLFKDSYRKISPSRFGYPESHVPLDPTPENQAKAFKELLDELNIEKTFILTTSAGGAAGIKFSIMYPDRVKGIILLSSGMPTEKKIREEIGMTGPPSFIINDFLMWFSLEYLGFIMNSMFGASENVDDLYSTLLPVKPRKHGIIIDTEITNIDMMINYDEYPIEDITAPILVVHAKDDPMAKYEDVKKFINKYNPQTEIFEDGGHAITGHDEEVSSVVKEFIESNK